MNGSRFTRLVGTPRLIPMPIVPLFCWHLAAAFLEGSWDIGALCDQGHAYLGERPDWLFPLTRRILSEYSDPARRPDVDALAGFIHRDKGFRGGTERIFRGAPRMAASPWPVPALPSPGALAEWLGLTPAELDWFADCQGREARLLAGPLRHYAYRWLAKRGGRARLIEMPKARLKAIQRRLLHEILDRIPPHEAAHGYRRGRSVLTYAAPHAGRAIVLRFDLRDFFPSVRAARVHALFRSAGYPAPVARLLTGLCTNAAPAEVRDNVARETALPYVDPHLPQGAPTSPALANLCAYRFDCRLSTLAGSMAARYTRYADDLAFSGGEELSRGARRFQVLVCRVALEEGFEVHTRKSRFMRRAVRQQLAGVVVNERPNGKRADFDELKATLCNCARHGPASQNREGRADFRAHLLGRIAYVGLLNPARGAKLRRWFDRIVWDASPGSGG
jgi:RNA-directed DNA polymerase